MLWPTRVSSTAPALAASRTTTKGCPHSAPTSSKMANSAAIIRMTNISLLPGPGALKLDDLIADTDDAILMETNRSWSIDDRRYQFQFSTEIGWEIKGGKRGPMLKNPSYSGITTEFW